PGVRLSNAVTVIVIGMPAAAFWILSCLVGGVALTPRLFHTAPMTVTGRPATTAMPLPPPPMYFSGTLPAMQFVPVQLGSEVVGPKYSFAMPLLPIAPPSVPPFGSACGVKLPASFWTGEPVVAGSVISVRPIAGGVITTD